jgi:sigma-E factor negative regulatory protein RseA
MKQPAPEPDLPQQWISDLVDGRVQDPVAGCAAWADDADVRRTWHTYHLIGDVLRSDDFAAAPAHDAAFLAGLRRRLALEPVVLAPAPLAQPLRRMSWRVPIVVAAGFVTVAGVLVVLRQSQPVAAGPALAQLQPPAAARPTLLAAPAAADARVQMLRDAQVDDYLRAHREAIAGSPAALPGGGPRNVDLIVPQR